MYMYILCRLLGVSKFLIIPIFLVTSGVEVRDWGIALAYYMMIILLMSLLFQTSKLKEQIQKVRDVLAKKDTETAESIKAVTDELQKASLKLFEMAYRKVRLFVNYVYSQSDTWGQYKFSCLVS